MRSNIIQKLFSSLLTFALITSIIVCSLRFVPNSEPPLETKQQLLEAPIVQHIFVFVAWFKANVTRGTAGSSRGMPKPPRN